MLKVISILTQALILTGAAQMIAPRATATDLALQTTACALQNLAGFECYATIF